MKVSMLYLLGKDFSYCVEFNRLVDCFNRITFIQER
jgi:hypothetical protein